jgi:hypothetical protein
VLRQAIIWPRAVGWDSSRAVRRQHLWDSARRCGAERSPVSPPRVAHLSETLAEDAVGASRLYCLQMAVLIMLLWSAIQIVHPRGGGALWLRIPKRSALFNDSGGSRAGAAKPN